MCNCAGVRDGNEQLTKSVQKLQRELVIPNDQIKLLDSIGQDVASCMDCELVLDTVIVSMYTHLVGITVEWGYRVYCECKMKDDSMK